MILYTQGVTCLKSRKRLWASTTGLELDVSSTVQLQMLVVTIQPAG